MSSTRTPRGEEFKDKEVDNLLDILEEILPTCKNNWEEVASRHVTSYPYNGRKLGSLKHKFQLLYTSEKLTGDPNCPPQV